MTSIPTLTGPSLPPAAGGPPREIILLLHGYGSNGADLLGLAPLWRHARPHALFVAPNAPERCTGAPGGYQWWALTEISRAGIAGGAARAAPALDAYIDGLLAEHGLGADRLVIVGFSQGTMMALQVGIRRESAVAGIVAYSGMLADNGRLAGEVRSKPPILLIHGAADSVVPPLAFHDAKAGLHRLGFDVEAHLIPGLDHGVDDHGIRAGGRFLARVLGGSAA
jgi:phospholipase/carboxylesterase